MTDPVSAFIIGLVLLGISALYARLLAHIRHIYARRYTWVTVVVGFLLTYSGPMAYVTINPQIGAWEVVSLFWGAVVITGTPIIAWQITDVIQRENDAEDFERRERRIVRSTGARWEENS